MKPEIRSFDSAEALAVALASLVAAELAAVLARRTRTALALPGAWERTAFDRALFCHDLDWARVRVTPTDAPWRPPGDGDPAAANSRSTLPDQPPALNFLPLGAQAGSPEVAARRAGDVITAHVLPLDVCVLVMSGNGGIAGLLPGGDRLAEATDPVCREPVLPMREPGAEATYLTLTLPALQSAARFCIVLSGAAARGRLEQAMAPGPQAGPPVRALVRGPRPLTAFYVA